MARSRAADRGIYPLAPGVWRVQVSGGLDVARTAQSGRPVYRTIERRFHGTKTDARDFRASLIVEARQGRYGGTEATVDDLFDAWVRELDRIGRAPSTIKGYRRVYAAEIRPVFGRVKVRNLTPRMIADHLAACSERGLAPNTVRIVHTCLSSMFSQAARWEWVDKDPTKLVRGPSLPNRRPVIPTVDEVAALLSAAGKSKRPEMQRAIWLSATTGVRRGELAALRIADFDLDGGRMSVERALSAGKVWTTKNRRWREVAIDPLTVAVVAAQVAALEQRALAAGVTLAEDAYLFTDRPTGAVPWHPDRITVYFARLKKALGLGHITFHQLRKFMESMALDAGFSPAEVAHRAGHDPAVLMRFYAGSVDEKSRAMASVVSSLLEAPPAEVGPWVEECPHPGCGWSGKQARNHHNGRRAHEHDDDCALCAERNTA